MNLGFSKVNRKLSKGKYRSMSVKDNIYFMDDEDRVFARLQNENHLSLFVTAKDGSILTLNLVYNFKYKCNQDVIIGDVAFMSEANIGAMPVISKNRMVTFAADDILALYPITSCGTVDATNEHLTVSIPDLKLEDTCTNVVRLDFYPNIFFHLTTRAIH